MSDRVLIPFGTRLLCLSRDTFETALRDGAAIARATFLDVEEATASGLSQEAAGTRLLSVEAASAMLSVDPQWLLRQAREGNIPHVRLGRFVRFDAAAIADACRRPASSAATATSATSATRAGR
jgi:hypothetical protein